MSPAELTEYPSGFGRNGPKTGQHLWQGGGLKVRLTGESVPRAGSGCSSSSSSAGEDPTFSSCGVFVVFVVVETG